MSKKNCLSVKFCLVPCLKIHLLAPVAMKEKFLKSAYSHWWIEAELGERDRR